MKSARLFLAAVLTLVLFFSLELRAQSNFTDNALTPYPLGCATTPSRQTLLYGDNVHKFYEGQWSLKRAGSDEPTPVNVALYRVACAEPGRSVIWVEFSMAAAEYPGVELELPLLAVRERVRDPATGETEDIWLYLDLVTEPGSWEAQYNRDTLKPLLGDYTSDNAGGDGDTPHYRWLYILEVPSPRVYKNEQEWVVGAINYLSADRYNGEFTLVVADQWKGVWGESGMARVPSTASVVSPNPEIPLNGRLSGLWAAPEASDQGVVINVATAPVQSVSTDGIDYGQQLHLFLSWYTYDVNGNPLWLTGAAPFDMGDTQVTVSLVQVEGGQFMGDRAAGRVDAGTVTITGINCNDLGFEYNLGPVGLGSGSTHLQRLSAMELAGYACRDMAARWENVH
ncbi:MAG TPA: hypothetical protein VFG52_05185 [Xanthomonadales bacterium]|nr:hypothetical protein [Xanthomonadales bacterium]